jgi:Flp pilus assembly protein TadD
MYYLEQIDAQLHSHESRASLAEARGLDAMWNKKSAAAIEHFQHAVSEWEKVNRTYDQARALNLLGQALLRMGDTHQAHSVFERARSVIDMLAAQLEDAELRLSFMRTEMVQEIRTGHSLAMLT